MISAVVIAKNEEGNIKECLGSLAFCDEIVVIDDNSLDKTAEIAKKLGASVYSNKLDNFSQQRNFGLSKAENDWVILVDADERVSQSLAVEIKKRVLENKSEGFLIKREDTFMGKKMKGGDLGNVWLLRLGKKSKGSWTGDIHEKWEIKGKIAHLNNSIIHKSHENLSDFIEKINFYSTLRAKELKLNKTNSSILDIIIFPKAKFINLYFFKLGFRDGMHGFVHALFMSFYTFLVRGKLYQLNRDDK